MKLKAAPSSPSRYVSADVKKQVRLRSGDQCEFVVKIKNPVSGQFVQKRCNGKSQMQFDHRFPFALGGKNEKENIRHLCREHNILAAENFFGKLKYGDKKLKAA
jgi:5-methylcytosine-specific restriction endonuclease McrA